MSDPAAAIRAALKQAAAPASTMLGDSAPVVVYGAGGMGRDVVAALAGRGTKVRCVLDRNPAKASGAPPSASERASVTVAVAVFNPEADPLEIRTSLSEAGYRRIVGFQQVHRELAGALGDRYWLTAPGFYAEHKDAILEALDWWADESSRELYAAVLRSRLLADESLLPPPSLDDQYFPANLPAAAEPVWLVDCGAYTGDTLADAMRRGVPIAAACAFEPDPANFAELAGWVRSSEGESRPAVYLWPCAVGRETGAVTFGASRGGATSRDEGGSRMVPSVALDDVIPDFPATLLKLDVEGAEPEALSGAAGLIRRWRPRLAVCVYHRPEHLWAIPRLVRTLEPAYDLHLRLHRFNGFDLVLYALPRT